MLRLGIPLMGLCAFGLASCSSQAPVVPSLASQSGAVAKSGQVVWHDLITPDPAQARSFYGELLGWSFSDSGSSYSVIRSGNEIVGGMVDGRKLGARPRSSLWLVGIGTGEMDATVKELRSKGATVRQEPTEVPERGRTALIEDPEKALFQLIELKPGARRSSSTTWIWHELLSADPKASADWYAQIDGIGSRSFGSGDRRQLTLAGRAGASISKNPFEDTRNTWVPVVGVNGLTGKLAKVDQLGGRVVLPPSEGFGDGKIALILDPSGAPLILQQKKGGQS